MATLRRIRPLPISAGELTRLRDTLHEHYGNTLAQGTGGQVLVIHVPRDDPDMVNDVEASIEYLNPGEVAQAHSIILIGNAKSFEVPPQMLRDLMAARVAFDRRQCHLLRSQMQPGEHRLFKAPEDPRRLVRLAIRSARARVAEISDDDLEGMARELGPNLASPAYKEIRSVYLIANKDDVRMDADLLFQDLGARWTEESERHRLAKEIEARGAKRIQEEAVRQKLLEPRPEAPPTRIAVAPLRSPQTGSWESDPTRAAMYDFLDALGGKARSSAPPHIEAAPGPFTPSTTRPAARPVQESTQELSATSDARTSGTPSPDALAPGNRLDASAAPKGPSPSVAAVTKALEERGFECLMNPGHGLDVAAERSGMRVIVFCPPRLDRAAADRAVTTATTLQVDLALIVCPEADADAKKRLVATRARWVDPASLAELAV